MFRHRYHVMNMFSSYVFYIYADFTRFMITDANDAR